MKTSRGGLRSSADLKPGGCSCPHAVCGRFARPPLPRSRAHSIAGGPSTGGAFGSPRTCDVTVTRGDPSRGDPSHPARAAGAAPELLRAGGSCRRSGRGRAHRGIVGSVVGGPRRRAPARVRPAYDGLGVPFAQRGPTAATNKSPQVPSKQRFASSPQILRGARRLSWRGTQRWIRNPELEVDPLTRALTATPVAPSGPLPAWMSTTRRGTCSSGGRSRGRPEFLATRIFERREESGARTQAVVLSWLAKTRWLRPSGRAESRSAASGSSHAARAEKGHGDYTRRVWISRDSASGGCPVNR